MSCDCCEYIDDVGVEYVDDIPPADVTDAVGQRFVDTLCVTSGDLYDVVLLDGEPITVDGEYLIVRRPA